MFKETLAAEFKAATRATIKAALRGGFLLFGVRFGSGTWHTRATPGMPAGTFKR